ncbi:hypothetical protein RCO48_13180 [Peribacillus frigoritolerans]|nr:hypothetical protein [Peribacillus frigoritolerans]
MERVSPFTTMYVDELAGVCVPLDGLELPGKSMVVVVVDLDTISLAPA